MISDPNPGQVGPFGQMLPLGYANTLIFVKIAKLLWKFLVTLRFKSAGWNAILPPLYFAAPPTYRGDRFAFHGPLHDKQVLYLLSYAPRALQSIAKSWTGVFHLVRMDEVLGRSLVTAEFGRRDGERVQDRGELALVKRQLI